LSIKRAKTLKKPSIMEYFYKITSSREAVIDFVKNELTKYKNTNGYNIAYNAALSKNTTSTADITTNEKYNYKAFLEAIQEHGLNIKDIYAIYNTGQSLFNAEEAFADKTKSADTIQAFLTQLTTESPEKSLAIAYTDWFIKNTNAIRTNITALEPVNVDWSHFSKYCKQKFNYNSRDLVTLSKGMPAVDRLPIKDLFKKAANTNRKNTLKYLKNFATEYPTALSLAYNNYMGKYATDISAVALYGNTDYNYKAWLEKVTDPNGPVKLTKEEVLKYFREYKAETMNNN